MSVLMSGEKCVKYSPLYAHKHTQKKKVASLHEKKGKTEHETAKVERMEVKQNSTGYHCCWFPVFKATMTTCVLDPLLGKAFKNNRNHLLVFRKCNT